MLQENGPFIIPPGAVKPVLNERAWNKNAGVVYF
jgi:carboxypeptidase C (cathepsin A)